MVAILLTVIVAILPISSISLFYSTFRTLLVLLHYNILVYYYTIIIYYSL